MITDRELIVNDHHGIYAGQQAAYVLTLEEWGMDPQDIRALRAGPSGENEDYEWAVDALDSLEWTAPDGKTWRLEWDEGSLWAATDWVPDDCVVLELPEWTLPYLVNADATGLAPDELAELEGWTAKQGPGFDVLQVGDEEERSFSRWHDGPGLAADCVECVCRIGRTA